jgi:hypothetical protein
MRLRRERKHVINKSPRVTRSNPIVELGNLTAVPCSRSAAVPPLISTPRMSRFRD